ncbi:response regulator [Zhouia sp. PK063]|uniref:response regulator n=1 Tax=Zhouia sp. PK063 TaxID=3373602 RepID=UPI00379CDAF7
MFQKILIAEDIDGIHESIQHFLEDLQIPEIAQVHYCDDAMLKLKRGVVDHVPYDLLITDLSFIQDHRNQHYPSGESLIKAVKEKFPSLCIIAYSVEDRLQKVRHLIQDVGIQAYVCKGRNGIAELKKAITAVANEKTYVSPRVAQALHPHEDINIDSYDVSLLTFLAQGHSQEDISSLLKKQQLSPNSLSSIEKKINRLKIILQAKNTIQLIAIAKDTGLI